MSRGRTQWLRSGAAIIAACAGTGAALLFGVIDAGADSTSPSAITGGQTLTNGATMESSDGHYQVSFTNGILSNRITNGRTLWSEGSTDPTAYAVLQPNGLIVIFSGNGQVLWSSGATGTGCPALNLQINGDFVDYDTGAIWLANTAEHSLKAGDLLEPGWSLFPVGSEYELTMQTDGNLVIYNDSKKAIWQTKTDGNAGAYADMQSDGNFVVYSAAKKALWSTKTSGNPGATLDFSSSGDFDIDSTADKSLYSSGSTGMAGTGSAFTLNSVNASATPCPSTVAPPTTTVVETETQTVTNTQTVLVPTTTVLTVAPPKPSKLRHFDVPIKTHWTYQGDHTSLSKARIGRLPGKVTLTITYNTHTHGHRPLVRRAHTRAGVRKLVELIKSLHYRPGQTLELNLTRKGFEHEWAVFTIRTGKLPEVRPVPHPARRKISS